MENLATKWQEDYSQAIGKTIKNVVLDEASNELHIAFTDGHTLLIWDSGQNCCENRYMRTDDDLTKFAGATFVGIEVRDAPDIADAESVHEVQFLLVNTSLGTFTMASHNEHNGYYSGFEVVCRLEVL